MEPVFDLWTLGGTIAMTPSADGGVVPDLSAADLVASLAASGRTSLDGAVGTLSLRPRSISNIASANIDMAMMHSLASEAGALTDSAGLVISQGTDTLEESAFAFQLFYRGRLPVIFTAAMRPPEAAGADGPANLAASLAAIRHYADRGVSGVAVLMNDQLYAPAYVKKAHTSRVDAFVADGGPLAHIVEGQLISQAPLPSGLGLSTNRRLPDVRLIKAVTGDDGDWLGAVCASADAIVVEALGGGHISEIWRDHLAEIAQNKPVVFASRCGAGPIMTQSYGYKGGEMDLIALGFAPAGRLDAPRARLALMAALSTNMSTDMSEGAENWRLRFKKITESV